MENLIIRSEFENLTAAETEALKKHVPDCPDCQKLQGQMAHVRLALKSQPATSLKPRPEIRFNLIKHLQPAPSPNKKTRAKIGHKLLAVFEYRIPVYQGLIALVMMFFIFILSNRFNSSVDQSRTGFSQYAQTDTVRSSQMNIMDDLSLIENQRFGKSVSEDSMLIKFLYSAM